MNQWFFFLSSFLYMYCGALPPPLACDVHQIRPKDNPRSYKLPLPHLKADLVQIFLDFWQISIDLLSIPWSHLPRSNSMAANSIVSKNWWSETGSSLPAGIALASYRETWGVVLMCVRRMGKEGRMGRVGVKGNKLGRGTNWEHAVKKWTLAIITLVVVAL